MTAVTDFGFVWGQVTCERVASIGERRVVSIETPYARLQVYASPTGRSLRVFRDGRELK